MGFGVCDIFFLVFFSVIATLLHFDVSINPPLVVSCYRSSTEFIVDNRFP